MGHFQDAITDWNLGDSLRAGWRVDVLTAACRRVETLLAVDSPSVPPEVDIEAVYRRLRAIAEHKASMQALTRRDLRISVWTVFRTFSDELPPLCNDPQFFSEYAAAIEGTRSSRAILALTLNFLEEYPRQSPRFDAICSQLLKLIWSGGARLTDLLARVNNYQLLDAGGPSKIAQQLVYGDGAIAEILSSAYLVGSRANRGLADYVHEALCGLLKDALTRARILPSQLSRALEFCVYDEGGRHLRIAAQRGLLAESLLSPFRDRSPSKPTQQGIKKFMLELYGDPRTQAAKWLGVSPDCRAVLIRWLVQDTFEDFFRIVDLTQSEDKDADRQWPYRRAFWMAYFRLGVISDAWLVLGSAVADKARIRLGIDPRHYGQLEGYGVKSTHAVLILKIQDYIFVEWSHVGKYRLWHEGDAFAPRLYARTYDRSSLTKRPAEEGVHFSASAGGWQSRLEHTIRGRTGIYVGRSDYMRGV